MMKMVGHLVPLGALLVASWATSVAAAPYKSAEIITRETHRYGAVEARLRAAEGSGFITALFFWRPGSEADLDNWQEQDFEIFGKDGTYQTQIMTPGRTQHQRFFSLYTPAYENYYTYRLEWTPDYLAFYVDGHLVRVETDQDEYQKLLDPDQAEPAEVRLSLWGDDIDYWSGEFDEDAVPAAAFFDYCALYAYTPGAGPDGSDFTLRWRDDFNSINTSRWWLANWGWDRSSDYVPQNARTINGKLVLAITHESQTGTFPSTIPADNPPLPPATTAPDSPIPDPADVDPFPIPSRLEAEVVSDYYDTTPGNQGDPECSVTDIDAQRTSDSQGGDCNTGWSVAGEWMEYPISVDDAGTYDFTLRLAVDKKQKNSVVQVDVDGVDVSGDLSVPANGWQNFSDVTFPVDLPSGIQTIRLNVVQGPVNINYIDIARGTTTPPPNPPPTPGEPLTVPARLEAESASDYYDTTPGNQGDEECGDTDVDAQTTSDSGGGCNIGWTVDGEWLEYPIQVDAAGSFDFVLRMATDTKYDDSVVRLDVDGDDVSGPISVPNLGWQKFSNVVVPVNLQAGSQTVRLTIENGPVNVNYIDIVGGSSTPPTDPPTDPPTEPVCDLSPTTYQAESLDATTGAAQGSVYNLWSNGTLSGGHSFEGGDTIVSVVARGQSALGVWPHMIVRIGNTVIGDVYVDSSNLDTYEFYADTSASSETISIEFDNDYYESGGADRNLLLDAIIVDDCP